MERNFDQMVERLMEMPCWVVDFLPRRVSQDGGGQFFAVERYYLEEPQFGCLCARLADTLLKLNCYHDLHVSCGEEWVKNPMPAILVAWVTEALKHGHLCALIDDGTALVAASGGDTHLTLYNPSLNLLELVGQLASSAGLFLWQPQDI